MEPLIWKYLISSRLYQAQSIKHIHIMFLHQKCDANSCRSGHTRIAMNKDFTTSCDSLFNKFTAAIKMFRKVFPRNIHCIYNFILHIRRKARIETRKDLKNMSNTLINIKNMCTPYMRFKQKEICSSTNVS